MFKHTSKRFCPECLNTKLELASGVLSEYERHLLVCPNCFFRLWIEPKEAN